MRAVGTTDMMDVTIIKRGWSTARLAETFLERLLLPSSIRSNEQRQASEGEVGFSTNQTIDFGNRKSCSLINSE